MSGVATPLRVLLADDDPKVLVPLQRALSKEGIQVTTAANGQEAWEALQGEPFDLLITDVMMPVMDGFELLQQIRETRHLKNLPVIMMTWPPNIDTPETDEEMTRWENQAISSDVRWILTHRLVRGKGLQLDAERVVRRVREVLAEMRTA